MGRTGEQPMQITLDWINCGLTHGSYHTFLVHWYAVLRFAFVLDLTTMAHSPVCNHEVPHDAINAHLDKGCQGSQPSTSKLAPLFTQTRLGKRGTDTRPSNTKSSKRANSPDVITIDDEDTAIRPSLKRLKVESTLYTAYAKFPHF